MAEFAEDLHNFKLSLPFVEMDSNVELMNVIAELNPSMLENTSLNEQSLMGFPNDSFLMEEHQQTVLPVNFVQNVPGSFHADGVDMASQPERKKRKVMALSENSSGNSCPPGSETALGAVNKTSGKNSLGRGKRGRSNDKALKKPNEVIHVRARRGQATDSHSLAERVRREKINEKLRSLQDLVPGCYKAMGMAVMLDEIINYVQSLKNQVDFLSMKLAAASSFYDFNSDNETMGTMQGANAYEAQEMERLVREGYGGLSCFHSTWPF